MVSGARRKAEPGTYCSIGDSFPRQPGLRGTLSTWCIFILCRLEGISLVNETVARCHCFRGVICCRSITTGNNHKTSVTCRSRWLFSRGPSVLSCDWGLETHVSVRSAGRCPASPRVGHLQAAHARPCGTAGQGSVLRCGSAGLAGLCWKLLPAPAPASQRQLDSSVGQGPF